MTPEELVKLLNENKELHETAKTTVITEDLISNLFQARDPKIIKELDRHTTKAIESFKEKGLQTLLETKKAEWEATAEKEFAAKHGIQTDPGLKALQDKIAELEKANVEVQKEKKLAEINSKKANLLSSKKLDHKLSDFITADDAEQLEARINDFSSIIESLVNEKVSAKLKGNRTTPADGISVVDSKANPFMHGQMFNLTKQAQLLKENPQLAAELQAMAKQN